MAITPTQWSHVLTIPESYTPSAAISGQTLKITEVTVAKLSSGDQSTFWANVQNGGGDVRICENIDGTNQLPVEVVSLDNAAQTCVIWTRKPSYDGTGNLYVFVGRAGETQPPVTDPFGRNAVWQDLAVVIHGGMTFDSTGNLTQSATQSGAVTQNADSWEFNRSAGEVNFGNYAPPAGLFDFAIMSCVQLGALPLGNDAIGGTANAYLLADNQSSVANTFVGGVNGTGFRADSGANTADTALHNVCYRWGNGSASGSPLDGYDIYLDGVVGGSVSGASGSMNSTPQTLTVGGAPSFTANPIDGRVFDFWIFERFVSPDEVEVISENQLNQSTFYGTPTLTSTAGGEVIEDSTVSVNISSLNELITIPNAVIVDDSLGNIGVTSINESISLTGLVSVDDSQSSININSFDESIALAGSVSVDDDVSNANISAINESVVLGAVVIVSDAIANNDIASINEIVTISGAVVVQDAASGVNAVSVNEAVNLAGLVEVSDSQANTNVGAINETIFLSVPVAVTDALSNINVTSQNETVSLAGQITLTDSISTISISAINENVVVGDAVTVAPVYTIAFKDDGYTVSYKEDGYSISYED
jgi:hypothetical protein